MAKTKKDGSKVDNGLKRLINRYCPNRHRLDYANAVVEYAKEELNKTVTANQLYLLVNDHVELTLTTMWVYDALETVLQRMAALIARSQATKEENELVEA